MKKLGLILPALTLTAAIGLPAGATFAAGEHNLTQADFTAALASCDGTTVTNGIICYNAGETLFKLTSGDYVIGENLTVPNDIYFSDGNVNINLNGKNLALGDYGAIVFGTGTSTISGSGAVSNAAGERVLDIAPMIVNPDGTTTPAAEGGTATINGGTYTGGAQVGSTNLTINNGTFTSATASGIFAFNDGKNITINGGTFSSPTSYFGLQIEGVNNLTITGGTFSGRYGGLNLAGYTSAALSGGTYSYTADAGPDEMSGAIIIGNTSDVIELNDLLAPGYFYSDSTAGHKTLGGMGGFDVVYLTNKNVTISTTPGGSDTDSDTTGDSETASTSVGTPDSGFSTKEAGNATTSTLAGGIAAAILGAGAFIGRKIFARK